ncbi:MAG: hypothetical protein ABEJ40_11335 [Haloarculaceae archaeon]
MLPFLTRWSVPLENDRTAVSAVDLEADGVAEIAVSDVDADGGGSAFGFVRDGEWLWEDASTGTVGIARSGDVDGDGRAELVFVSSGGPDWVRPYPSDGEQLWSADAPGGVDPGGTFGVDYDADGSASVVATASDGRVRLYDSSGEVVWDARSSDLVEATLDVRDVTGDERPELLTRSSGGSGGRPRLRLVAKDDDGGLSQGWAYGPAEPVDAGFTRGAGSTDVLAAYGPSGEFHGVSADGDAVWTRTASVTGGRAAVFETGEAVDVEAAVWSGTTVAVYESAGRTVTEFETDSTVERVEPLGHGLVAAVTDGALVVADPDFGVLGREPVDGDVEGIAVEDADGDGSVTVAVGYPNELTAYRIDLRNPAVGRAVWENTYGGSGGNFANDVIETSDGHYLLAGESDVTDGDEPDTWLLKVAPDGTVRWERTRGGAGADVGRSVTETSDGDYLLAGETESEDGGDFDGWLLKIRGPDAGKPPDDVSKRAFDAVAGDDGEVGQDDVVRTVRRYATRRPVDGVVLDRSDVLGIVRYYVASRGR